VRIVDIVAEVGGDLDVLVIGVGAQPRSRSVTKAGGHKRIAGARNVDARQSRAEAHRVGLPQAGGACELPADVPSLGIAGREVSTRRRRSTMKITAAPSPRGTNNERLFLFHCPRDGTLELARPRQNVGDCFFRIVPRPRTTSPRPDSGERGRCRRRRGGYVYHRPPHQTAWIGLKPRLPPASLRS